MAFIRREAVRVGISYGSGIIDCGNDEFAYIEALRAFPEDKTYENFRKAVEDEDLEAAKANAVSLRDTVSHLAMSDLYMRCKSFVSDLNDGCMPPAESLDAFDEKYRTIVDYCSTH